MSQTTITRSYEIGESEYMAWRVALLWLDSRNAISDDDGGCDAKEIAGGHWRIDDVVARMVDPDGDLFEPREIEITAASDEAIEQTLARITDNMCWWMSHPEMRIRRR